MTIHILYVIVYIDPYSGNKEERVRPLSNAVLSARSTTMDIGPMDEWMSPSDVVAWLRNNLLVSGSFNLREWERGQEWAHRVGCARGSYMSERDALIILEFARMAWTEKTRERLDTAASLLHKLLDEPLHNTEKRRDETARWGRNQGNLIGQEATLVVSRFVHLGRRWPRG